MHSTFSILDWVIITGFLVFCGVIGILARKRVTTLADFLVAGRKLRSLWGFATLSSTEMGLVTIVYFSEEAYRNGFVAIAAGIIAGLMMWIIGKTGFVISRLRSLNVMTVPEYFEDRFHPKIRLIAGILTFMAGILNVGIFLQVEGTFLAVILGVSVAYIPLIMGVLLVIVLIYTILGGMFSVVLTDLVQFVFIAIGISIITYFAFVEAGGFGGMIHAVDAHYGSAGFNLWDAPSYGLLFLIWTSVYYLSGWSSWQPVSQRVFSMRNVEMAQKLFRISSFFMFFRAAFPMMWGIAALAALGVVPDSRSALPTMLVDILPAGVIGLVTIGFLAASMSTYDSYLLAFGSIFAQDIAAKFFNKPLTDEDRMKLTRAGVMIIGVFVYFWGVYYQFSESVFRYITLTGSLSFAGTMTALVAGMYWKRATTFGAYCAFTGSAIPPAIGLWIPDVNSTYFGLMSFVLAPVGMVAGSLFWPGFKSRRRPS